MFLRRKLAEFGQMSQCI